MNDYSKRRACITLQYFKSDMNLSIKMLNENRFLIQMFQIQMYIKIVDCKIFSILTNLTNTNIRKQMRSMERILLNTNWSVYIGF